MNTVADRHPRLDECESLRGIAIILVFSYHFLGSLAGYGLNAHVNLATGLFFGGNAGVDLFFVLSGFLLSLPYFRGSPLVPRQFFANRALRILPMYYVMVLIAVAWGGDRHAAWQAALFWNIGLETLPPFGVVWWSLVVEVQFYLALPILVYLARLRYGRRMLAVVLVCLGFCYWKAASPSASAFWAAQHNSLLGRWPEFAAGIAAAWLHQRHGARLRSLAERRRRWIGTLIALGALAGVDVIAVEGLRWFGVWRFADWYAQFLYLSILWAAFLIAVIDLLPVCRDIVVNPLLHRIGVWSYSIYLMHPVLIVFVVVRLGLRPSEALLTDHLGSLMLFIYIAGATLLVSAATYHLIEKPFLQLKRSRFLMIGQIREDAM